MGFINQLITGGACHIVLIPRIVSRFYSCFFQWDKCRLNPLKKTRMNYKPTYDSWVVRHQVHMYILQLLESEKMHILAS